MTKPSGDFLVARGSDVDRRPRTDDKGAIHKRGARDEPAGCYVMTDAGHLILVPPSAYGELKAGQRLATSDDIAEKQAEEAERKAREREPVSSSEPAAPIATTPAAAPEASPKK